MRCSVEVSWAPKRKKVSLFHGMSCHITIYLLPLYLIKSLDVKHLIVVVCLWCCREVVCTWIQEQLSGSGSSSSSEIMCWPGCSISHRGGTEAGCTGLFFRCVRQRLVGWRYHWVRRTETANSTLTSMNDLLSNKFSPLGNIIIEKHWL